MKNRYRVLAFFLLLFGGACATVAGTSSADSAMSPERMHVIADSLRRAGLRSGQAFELLKSLTVNAPHRLSGSPGAAAAIALMKTTMDDAGFNNVHVEEVIVPRWVRGDVEECSIVRSRLVGSRPLRVCALGGSVATPAKGIVAGVVEVHSFQQLAALGAGARGKIVFFNRPFDPTTLDTFDAYSATVDQRVQGASEASNVGAVAVIVRSVTAAHDNVPHTGMMRYKAGVPEIPAAAIGREDADLLSTILAGEPDITVRLDLSCTSRSDVVSANVIGELTGTENPEEVILVGGHLDAWDKGQGAHDDGAGCVQAIEVLRLLKDVGFRPKRTVRAVLFMNEENGGRGGKAYPLAASRKPEKHVLAIESDGGGFAPRGFSVEGDSTILRSLKRWKWLFDALGAGDIKAGGSGSDIEPLAGSGIPCIGLQTEDSRYFDYHHSDNDTLDKVNPRELEMGAIVEAILCVLMSEGVI